MTTPAPVLLTTAEAAQALGVSVRTIQRWVDSRRIKPAKQHGGGRGGGSYVFTAEEVARVAALPRAERKPPRPRPSPPNQPTLPEAQ